LLGKTEGYSSSSGSLYGTGTVALTTTLPWLVTIALPIYISFLLSQPDFSQSEGSKSGPTSYFNWMASPKVLPLSCENWTTPWSQNNLSPRHNLLKATVGSPSKIR